MRNNHNNNDEKGPSLCRRKCVYVYGLKMTVSTSLFS